MVLITVALTLAFTFRGLFNSASAIRLSAVPPSINTSSGIFCGAVNATSRIESFKGVRYAQPPIGDLRFAAPLRLTRSPDDIQDASNFGNACPQLGLSEAFTILYGSPSLDAEISEDCLFLNIYRPQGTLTGSRLPILVFIHGGAYSVGAGSQFQGISLIQQSVANGSPIIFITINYRLYITGFLSSSILPPEDLNAGLLDQRLAFQFIQDNAEAFGGDPDKITLWGQSAGASSIALHYLYPTSDQLFRGAIQDSGAGTILNVPSVEQYDQAGKPFDLLLTLSGCQRGNSTLQCLRNITIDNLLNMAQAIDNISPQAAPGQSTTWLPSRGPEGSMIPELPSVRTSSGDFFRVPLITGTNLDEGTLFGLSFLGPTAGPSADASIFNTFVVNRTIDPTTVSSSTVGQFDAFYPAKLPSTVSNSSLFDRLAAFVDDFHFVGPRRLLTDNLAVKQDVWVYLFEEAVPDVPAELGAFHGAELSFLQILNRTVPAMASLSSQLVDFYLNFTVSLDPGPAWSKYTPSTRQVLQLQHNNVTMIPDDFRLNETNFINSAGVDHEFGR
ncbi:alpha/beta-hydrolase [Rickenella mellea]|uniref:Carboxylic ester hydrolase n=1 Tax=Rickenella mellea TaxID=50990 RepID=A0A4R5XGG9_9AGAM|nr:alpha/beta-hydrolase [Rickenella mellea]